MRFIKACQREEVDCLPVWFMRQAGRYLPEYRAIRAEKTFLEVMRDPLLCTEVTLQPMRRFELDAAILFADIMTPLEGIGVDYDIAPGVGPVVPKPLRSLEDLGELQPLKAEESLAFVLEAIERIRAELDGERALIGFAGAPFTLACYLIAGRPQKNFIDARRVMITEPELWHELMRTLSEMVKVYLQAQIRAGVNAVQLFDSWVGLLSEADYRAKVLPYVKSIFEGLADFEVPTIHFGTSSGHLLKAMADAGGEVIGVDWRTPMSEARSILGPKKAVQGNLDPAYLLGDLESLKRGIGRVIESAGPQPGHIFNLGHGVDRHTDPAMIKLAVDWVHKISSKR